MVSPCGFNLYFSWTVVLEKTLRVPWTARRSNQSILNEISPGCSLEGLMLKLKLQYFGHLIWRVDSLEKTLMLGGVGGRRRRGWQRMRWLNGITDSSPTWVWVNSGSLWWTGRPGLLRFMGSQSQTWLSDWTELMHLDRRILVSQAGIKPMLPVVEVWSLNCWTDGKVPHR